MGYFGSKSASGAFQAVIAQMPPHEVYIETHLGSGVVMRAKPRAPRSIGIDLDGRVFWNVSIREQIEDAAGAAGVELVHDDAVAWLEARTWSAAWSPDLRYLVYADPPYVLSTRLSARRYACDYTDDDHRRLVRALRALPANVSVILSGYPSALYDELVGDWRQIEFQVMTRAGARTEKLWMNFPAGAVAWSTYAGSGFAERQRIKRKAANWAKAYSALPAGERLAVLSALLGLHASPEDALAKGQEGAPGGATAIPGSLRRRP